MLLLTNPISATVYLILFSMTMVLVKGYSTATNGFRSVVKSKKRLHNWMINKISIQTVSVLIFVVFSENKLIMFLLHMVKLTELWLLFRKCPPIYYFALFITSCDLHALMVAIPLFSFTVKMLLKGSRIKKIKPNYITQKMGKDQGYNFNWFILNWMLTSGTWCWFLIFVNYFWLKSILRVY